MKEPREDEPKNIGNRDRSISEFYNGTLLTIVRSVSNCILHTQVFNILQVPKLGMACLESVESTDVIVYSFWEYTISPPVFCNKSLFFLAA